MSSALPNLSALQLALQAKRQRDAGQFAALNSEPIAVIGLACRFPGGADSPEAFWRLLREGREAVAEIPPDRWSGDEWYSADTGVPGKVSTRSASMLKGVDLFDPVFFGISPREAVHMDPQQRLLLEVVWEGLADAGQPVDELSGTRTGVFMAVFNSDYARQDLENVTGITQHTLSGGARSVAAGRISFLLDVSGPCVSVDTACSSSLVAAHLACQSLRNGESNMAIVGGASLRLRPQEVVALSKLGMLAPDGRCKAFDASADGFGFGEGCGVIVLKRLSDALQQKDPIHAVIRGSAINQDGRSNVLTAPNGLAQQALIREALANAQVSGDHIGLIEAHGTGTKLGDPIEVEALVETIGSEGTQCSPCALVSVKANIGHLEAAAGIAGLIKTVLCFRHGEIPPQQNFRELNPHIPLEGTRFQIPTQVRSWPRTDVPRLAGVSSFGFSGTNAHVVLEEPPLIPRGKAEADTPVLWAISARNEQALKDLAQRFETLTREAKEADLADLAFTANARRSHFEVRAAVLTSSIHEAQAAFHALSAGEAHPALLRPVSANSAPPKVAFVFSGQGAQRPGMGLELFRSEPVFRAGLEECDALFNKLGFGSLIDVLSADASLARLDHTELAQPAIFAVQMALARLWQSWGVTPAAVVGHSAGEIAAACAAGVLTLTEAARIVVLRGRVMEPLLGRGGMVQVALPAREAAERVAAWSSQVSVAAINSPTTCVLAGDADAISAVVRDLERQSVSVRTLPVRYAFHSQQMEDCSRALVGALGRIETRTNRVPLYSTVTGRLAASKEFEATYWGRNVREPVQFCGAIREMEAAGCDTFIEIAPHAVLSTSVVECLKSPKTVVPSMRRGMEERKAMMTAAGRLYAEGQQICWRKAHHPGGRCVALPAYPWQRQRYWLESTDKADVRATGVYQLRPVRSPSLTGRAAETEVSSSLPFVADHQIHGSMLLPMAAFVDLLSQFLAPDGRMTLRDLALHEPLRLDKRTSRTLQVTESGGEVGVHSWNGERWIRHVSATLGDLEGAPALPVPPEHLSAGSVEEHYAEFRRRGIDFGPSMRSVQSLRVADGYVESMVHCAADVDEPIDIRLRGPLLIDAAFQTLGHLLLNESSGVYLPLSIDEIHWFATLPAEIVVRSVLHAPGKAAQEVRSGDVFVATCDGQLVALFRGFRFKKATASALDLVLERSSVEEICFEERWEQSVLARKDSGSREWLILADHTGVADAVVEGLKEAGHAVHVVGSTEGLNAFDCRGVDAVLHLWTLDAPALPSDREFPATQSNLFGSVARLVQDLSARTTERSPQIHLVTRGSLRVANDRDATHPGGSMMWGLGRTLGLEHPELRGALIDLDPESDSETAAHALLAELLGGFPDTEIAYRGGSRWVRRLARRGRDPFEAGAWQLMIRERGTLENVSAESVARSAPASDEVQIRVQAAGLNFRDVLVALGMYPGNDLIPLGAECVGIVEAMGERVTAFAVGDAVMALTSNAFAQFVNVSQTRVAKVPRGLDWEQAATLPVTFLTALYALDRVARLRQGEKVLIHAAAGGVGLAAVQIARSVGAEVFATVGSPEKEEHLRSLGVQWIAGSRSVDFLERIQEWTGGRGVDVVLNSLNGEFIPASLACLAPGGRFVELGKKGIWTKGDVAQSRSDVRYDIVDLNTAADASPGLAEGMFAELVREVEKGTWKPLPHVGFSMRQAGDAFRYMAQARHIGKVVLRAPDRGLNIRPDAAYLITGGLGGLGLRVAAFLAQHGAKSLALLGRREPDARALQRIQEIEAMGARVLTVQADVADLKSLRTALATIEESLGSLRGVIHAAGLLDDGMLLNQSGDRYLRVSESKVQGAWALHQLTAGIPLDFFVLFSSVASVLGSPGQGNYAAANSFLDALVSLRRSSGLPAVALHWGVWGGDGMAGRTMENGSRLGLKGMLAMPPDECLRALEKAMLANAGSFIVMRADWERLAAQLGAGATLTSKLHVSSSRKEDTTASRNVRIRLDSLPASQRRPALRDHLRQQTLRVLGLPANFELKADRPLISFGLDSLMAVELGNVLSSDLGKRLSVTVIFDHPTLDFLADHLLELLWDLRPQEKHPSVVEEITPGADVMDVENLTDKEAEALLAAELQMGGLRG